MLTQEQVATYQRDGFVVIDDVFSQAEVSLWREAADETAIRDEQLRGGAASETFHLLGLTSRHPSFLALAQDPRLVRLLLPLLGPDIQLQHSKLATKPPKVGAGAYPWHQDLAYFPHTNSSLAAVMVMLDDADEHNGCMYMVPGSHHTGMREHRVRGAFSGGVQPSLGWDLGVPVRVRSGGISIHHCLTLHGSPVNRSGLPRRGLVFQYRADDAYQLADHIFDDTGLLIAGTRRGVVRCESGTWLLPHVPARTPQSFGSAWNQQGPQAAICNLRHPLTQPQEMPQ